jgi:hypothetical protein
MLIPLIQTGLFVGVLCLAARAVNAGLLWVSCLI